MRPSLKVLWTSTPSAMLCVTIMESPPAYSVGSRCPSPHGSICPMAHTNSMQGNEIRAGSHLLSTGINHAPTNPSLWLKGVPVWPWLWHPLAIDYRIIKSSWNTSKCSATVPQKIDSGSGCITRPGWSTSYVCPAERSRMDAKEFHDNDSAMGRNDEDRIDVTNCIVAGDGGDGGCD